MQTQSVILLKKQNEIQHVPPLTEQIIHTWLQLTQSDCLSLFFPPLPSLSLSLSGQHHRLVPMTSEQASCSVLAGWQRAFRYPLPTFSPDGFGCYPQKTHGLFFLFVFCFALICGFFCIKIKASEEMAQMCSGIICRFLFVSGISMMGCFHLNIFCRVQGWKFEDEHKCTTRVKGCGNLLLSPLQPSLTWIAHSHPPDGLKSL